MRLWWTTACEFGLWGSPWIYYKNQSGKFGTKTGIIFWFDPGSPVFYWVSQSRPRICFCRTRLCGVKMVQNGWRSLRGSDSSEGIDRDRWLDGIDSHGKKLNDSKLKDHHQMNILSTFSLFLSGMNIKNLSSVYRLFILVYMSFNFRKWFTIQQSDNFVMFW
jgi:hypothetical protein